MDKYEFNIKVEQIKKLVNRGDYATAMKIADTIDWRRVRNGSLLSMVSQIYEKNEEYQEAKEILLIAYERAPVGKRILYKLTDLALRDGSIGEAETFYREFCELAQDDPRQYLLRYLILKAKNAPIEQLIRALEMYTSTELDEKWMYELAELYHKAGLEDKCVATCDTIMLMFGLGKYVDKAMDLKLEYAPLNKYQMDLVENRDKYEAKLRAVEEEYSTKTYGDQAVEAEEEIAEEDEAAQEEVSAGADVIRIHEDAETEKLAQEMAKIADEPQTATVEEDEMGTTKALDDLHSIKEIKPTQRVLDAAAEREEAENAEAVLEIERQRAAIRAAKAREEMEAEALRRAEEEREKARREEAERRAKREAEIARERAQREEEERLARLEQERLEREKAKIEEEVEELDVESMDEAPEMYNLMIEAETDEEGLELAVEALKKIHRELGYKNPVAKISSEKLNKKGILAVAEKLAGKDLIIEHAAGLTKAVQNELDDLMERDNTGMIVVLIDTPENLEALHGTHASLASKFQYIGVDADAMRATEAAVEEALLKETAAQEKLAKETVKTAHMEATPVKVNEDAEKTSKEEEYDEKAERKAKAKYEAGEESDEDEESEDEKESAYESDEDEDSDHEYDDRKAMDADEFAQLACKYASEIDCSITGKSMLALYERIEMMEEDGVRLTEKVAVDLIEEAADKAEKQTLGRKIASIFSPAYDKEGFLILREKDFFD